jgi:signal peptidase I
MKTKVLPSVRWLSRIYSLLLYTYPREFRLAYGSEMERLFRDRCRDVARTKSLRKMVSFAIQSGVDWMTTTVRERAPRGFVSEWAVTILMYLFVTTTLVQAYVIPTGSMEGTLRVGDHVLVELPYRDVQRGDIAVFRYPEDQRQPFVKRVIGLPGDRIRIVDKHVFRNGQRLIEPYTQYISPLIDSYRDDFPTSPEAVTTPRGLDMFEHHVANAEVVVPPDALFVLGDNRDNSEDSRYWGFVPRDYVVGKPLVVYWSYNATTSDLEKWSLSHVVDVAEHFFTKTRWDRTFLIPRSQNALTRN